MIEVAAVLCIGVALLLRMSNHINKTKAQYLTRATRVKDLKGLGDLIGTKPLSRTVVVYGTVGSTSPIKNNRSGTLGVFVKETATLCLERKNSLRKEYKRIMWNYKKVPWYLDDCTARVNVMEAQYAKGFYDILKEYNFTQPVVSKLFEMSLMKDVQILQYNCCEYVLEIGTPLTLVGRAERDKDGAPTIARAYQVFHGHVNIDELVSNLESYSKYGDYSLLLTAIGVAIVAVRTLHIRITK